MRQGNDVGTQYRSAIYVADEAQREAAESSRAVFTECLRAAGHSQITTDAPLLSALSLPPPRAGS